MVPLTPGTCYTPRSFKLVHAACARAPVSGYPYGRTSRDRQGVSWALRAGDRLCGCNAMGARDRDRTCAAMQEMHHMQYTVLLEVLL